MNWIPIETYDNLKNKPKLAVFYVKESGDEGWTNCLPETISTDRTMGRRTITHWMPLPEPPEQSA